ncbi:MAG: acyl-CoA reductase [Oscillospiraceae bacterium]|nr:acyl-CoA reductase [Oscillospiraceae bacterium]
MNLVNGKVINSEECERVLENIDEMLISTLRKTPLDVEKVIHACDCMVQNAEQLDIIKKLPELGISPVLTSMYIGQVKSMLGADAIKRRLKIELGENYNKPQELVYAHSGAKAAQTLAPLGVLFHITAGNVDGLPFISLLDGLFTGNINIVKLPKQEGGITVSLLLELFKIAPELQEYVYVFDYSSKDLHAMRKLAKVANAIVVWGGDEAVSAVRRLAEPNTKIIEWGHKISFAYVTKSGAKNTTLLEKLAMNICLTNQLFCSSCQGIFIDTDNMDEVYKFCEEFLAILERISAVHPFAFDEAAMIFIKAGATLQFYHERIERSENKVFKGNDCSVTACRDSKLEPSMQYRNVWVKPLNRDDIINLRGYKNYLQTAALICSDDEYTELAEKLIRAGIIKVSDGFEMSSYALGEGHDGEFTLRCYTRVVSVQN